MGDPSDSPIGIPDRTEVENNPESETRSDSAITGPIPQPTPAERPPGPVEPTPVETDDSESDKWYEFWKGWTLTMNTVYYTIEIAGTIVFIVFVGALSLYCVQRYTD